MDDGLAHGAYPVAILGFQKQTVHLGVCKIKGSIRTNTERSGDLDEWFEKQGRRS